MSTFFDGRSQTYSKKVFAAPFMYLVCASLLISMTQYGCQTIVDQQAPITKLREVSSQVITQPVSESPIETRAQVVAPETMAEAEDILLTRDGALLTALLQNRGLDVLRLGPSIAATYVPEAQAQFDPLVGATVSFGHQTNPILRSPDNLTGVSSTTTAINNLASLSSAFNRLNQSLNNLQTVQDYQLDQNTNSGNISLQQKLPAGTQIFLTGIVSDSDVEGMAKDYRGGLTFGLRQPRLDGAGLGPNLAVLRQAEAKAAQGSAQFRSEVLATICRTELAYWELVLSFEVRKIREFALSLAEEQLVRTEELLRVGKAIEGDVMAARAERASRGANMSDANAAIRAGNVSLIRLLNPAESIPWTMSFAPVDAPEVVQLSVDARLSEQMALCYRPELDMVRLIKEQTKFAKLRARNALLPNLDLTGSYGHNSQGTSSSGILRHLDDGYYDEYSVGIEFETSLLNRAENARYRRARLETTQAERIEADVKQQVMEEVQQAVIEVEKQWQRLESVGEAMNSRAEQFRVAKGRYEVGKENIVDLHIVERDYIQAEVDEVTARVRYIQALTNLYAAEGTLLERRGIFLDKENYAHEE